jgi:hypothetical protein
MESPPSKTKDNADRAGHSALSVSWNHIGSSREPPLTFLNNSWLTAQEVKETKDATEDGPMPL